MPYETARTRHLRVCHLTASKLNFFFHNNYNLHYMQQDINLNENKSEPDSSSISLERRRRFSLPSNFASQDTGVGNQLNKRQIDEAIAERRNVYIRGLPVNTTDESLNKLGSRFGVVLLTKAVLQSSLEPDWEPASLSWSQFSTVKSEDKRKSSPAKIDSGRRRISENSQLFELDTSNADATVAVKSQQIQDVEDSRMEDTEETEISDNLVGRLPLCKGYGFILYENKSDAKMALSGLSKLGYEVSYAKTSFASRLKQLEDHETTNIYVSNLPPNSNEQFIRELFADFGPLESCIVLRDKKTDLPKPCGFAKLSSRHQAEQAIKELNGMMINGYRLKLKFADNAGQKSLKESIIKNKGNKNPPKSPHFADGARNLGNVSPFFGNQPSSPGPEMMQYRARFASDPSGLSGFSFIPIQPQTYIPHPLPMELNAQPPPTMPATAAYIPWNSYATGSQLSAGLYPPLSWVSSSRSSFNGPDTNNGQSFMHRNSSIQPGGNFLNVSGNNSNSSRSSSMQGLQYMPPPGFHIQHQNSNGYSTKPAPLAVYNQSNSYNVENESPPPMTSYSNFTGSNGSLHSGDGSNGNLASASDHSNSKSGSRSNDLNASIPENQQFPQFLSNGMGTATTHRINSWGSYGSSGMDQYASQPIGSIPSYPSIPYLPAYTYGNGAYAVAPQAFYIPQAYPNGLAPHGYFVSQPQPPPNQFQYEDNYLNGRRNSSSGMENPANFRQRIIKSGRRYSDTAAMSKLVKMANERASNQEYALRNMGSYEFDTGSSKSRSNHMNLSEASGSQIFSVAEGPPSRISRGEDGRQSYKKQGNVDAPVIELQEMQLNYSDQEDSNGNFRETRDVPMVVIDKPEEDRTVPPSPISDQNTQEFL